MKKADARASSGIGFFHGNDLDRLKIKETPRTQRSAAPSAETIRRDNDSREPRWLLLSNRQHQVVPVNHLGFSRVTEQLFKLRRRLAT